MTDLELLLLTLACGAGTYLFRGLGVALSGALSTSSPVFEWVGCVAYAMIAGLVARVILMPSGVMAQTPTVDRLAACAAAVAVYFLTRRNLFAGVCGGLGALIAINYARAALA